MTPSDVSPHMNDLDPLAQAKELATRLHGSLKLLQVSRHLIGSDRDQVDKSIEYVDLLRHTLRQMAGREAELKVRSNGELPALVPILDKAAVLSRLAPNPSRR